MYAPDGTGLRSEDLGQDAVLGGRRSSVEQRSRLGWRRRITIGVCGKSKCIAKFAESAQHVPAVSGGDTVNGVELSSDGRLLLVRLKNRSVVWDIAGARELLSLAGEGGVTYLNFFLPKHGAHVGWAKART